MGKIVVVGSSNVDLTAIVKTLPRPGETIGGASLLQANGGKGANQAVAAARLGGEVLFLTSVGDDNHGHMLESQFSSDGINVSKMKFVKDTPTGVALIFVDANGENCIAVAPGANNLLLPSDIDAAEEYIKDADYLLIQLEIPMETVQYAVDVAYRNNVKVVLNPAPMCMLSEDILSKIYLITPNETEAEKLTGVVVNNMENAMLAVSKLKSKGVKNVIITLGSQGSYMDFENVKEHIEATKVVAVDTTAAGDVYNGALVAALSEGQDPVQACKFASLASAISVTRKGAQTSVPYKSEVK